MEKRAAVKITLDHSLLRTGLKPAAIWLSTLSFQSLHHISLVQLNNPHTHTHTRPHRGLGLSNGGGECTWRREERGWLLFLCWVWQLGDWLGAERKLTPSRHSERLRPTWRPSRVLELWARPYTSIRHPASVSFTHQHNTCTCLKRQHTTHRPTYWPTLVRAHNSEP